MKKLNKHEVEFLIKSLKGGKELPLDYKYQLFPTKQKEYELAYAGKMRKEDLLANEDGVFPVPLQVEKVFNGDEYEAFDDDWKNMIVFGDNLQFLKTIYENKDPLIKNKVKDKVKLIYIDPPFATQIDFKGNKGQRAYTDKTKGAEFVEFLRKRLVIAKEILHPEGTLLLHLSSIKIHYIKILLDEIFGEKKFKDEIIWYCGRTGAGHTTLAIATNPILRYVKSNNFTWNKPCKPYTNEELSKFKKDDKGYYYTRGAAQRELKEWEKEKYLKSYIDKKRGKALDNFWDDVGSYSLGNEKMGYPTQKPEKLMKRLIEACTNKNDIVFDFFGGSGSTMAVAEKLGRKWITCDLGKLAYFTMQKRILQIQDSKDLENPKKKYDKKAKNFITAQLGIYDLKKALDLEWQKYQEFVSGLFEVEIKKNKIAGFEFDGKKGDYPVKIFDYRKFKNSAINENYLKEMHGVVGKKASGRVYIIAPANFVEFLTNYHEIDGVKYYFLKIPYHVIKELQKTPVQKLR